jgi:hypothetical protein
MTTFGSPANAGESERERRSSDETKIVRRLIVLDGTRFAAVTFRIPGSDESL